MKVMVRDRQQGKSSALVTWVLEGSVTDQYPGWTRVILTVTEDEAQRLRKDYGLDYRQVFSVGDWTNRAVHGRRDKVEVALDDADIILERLVGPLEVVTLTGKWLV